MTAITFRKGDHVKVRPNDSWRAEQSSANEAAWVSSKGGNPYGIWKITRIFENDGTFEDLPRGEKIAVLQMVSAPIGGWNVPISRLEHC